MATGMPAPQMPLLSGVLEVLRHFREQPRRGSGWTIPEIQDALWRRMWGPEWGDHLDWHDTQWWMERREGRYAAFVAGALFALEDLGLLTRDIAPEASSSLERWCIADSWRPPERPRGDSDGLGGGGRGSGSPPGVDGGGDGDVFAGRKAASGKVSNRP